MVTSVPYQLESSEVAKRRARKRQEWSAPGSVRRGPAARAAEGAVGQAVDQVVEQVVGRPELMFDMS